MKFAEIKFYLIKKIKNDFFITVENWKQHAESKNKIHLDPWSWRIFLDKVFWKKIEYSHKTGNYLFDSEKTFRVT